jgi:hypothetical protein
MFESEKISNVNYDPEKLSDEELIERYRYIQGVASGFINRRDNPEQLDITKDRTNEQLSTEEKKEIMQKGVESNFAELSRLRAEIDRRGLKVETMEERGM